MPSRIRRARLRFLSLALLAASATVACGTTLSSKVEGSSKPRTASCTPGEQVQIENGGFTIVQNCFDPSNTVVGDGILESTFWSFELPKEKSAACYPESATIRMRLRPTGDLIDERLRVRDHWAMGLEEIQSLEVGPEQTLVMDMMIRNGRPSPYTPSVIRGLLMEGGGSLAMSYELNALVSSAELTLACRQ